LLTFVPEKHAKIIPVKENIFKPANGPTTN